MKLTINRAEFHTSAHFSWKITNFTLNVTVVKSWIKLVANQCLFQTPSERNFTSPKISQKIRIKLHYTVNCRKRKTRVFTWSHGSSTVFLTFPKFSELLAPNAPNPAGLLTMLPSPNPLFRDWAAPLAIPSHNDSPAEMTMGQRAKGHGSTNFFSFHATQAVNDRDREGHTSYFSSF